MKKDASRFSPKGVLFHRTFFTAPFAIIEVWMNPRHRGGGEGARGPVDLGFAPTGAERRPNPPLATQKKAVKKR